MSAEDSGKGAPKMDVPWDLRFFGTAMEVARPLWKLVGNLETRVLADRLAGIQIDRPIFICGLARSGSTVVLEQIALHPDVTTHR